MGKVEEDERVETEDEPEAQEDPVAQLDAANARVGAAQREFLRTVAEVARTGAWEEYGARDLPHFLSMRYGIAPWKAHRWVAAARALKRLPLTAEALERGELSLDKVVELARFATPQDEAHLIRWAKKVQVLAIRQRGDRANRPSVREERAAHSSRHLEWWFYPDRQFGLFARLPAAEGALVARAIERVVETVPVLPGEEEPCCASARRADALVALAAARLDGDPDPDRATVVVHVRKEALDGGRVEAELEDGTILHPEVARRLACSARVQVVVEDEWGEAVAVTRARREPPAWMVRQLRYRDRGCVFPGCGTRRFTVAHHLRPWSVGGPTSLENLALVCTFHHRLVHELGWRVRRDRGGFRWTRPDGKLHQPGASPPGRDPPCGRPGRVDVPGALEVPA
jgi:hypothetical protein